MVTGAAAFLLAIEPTLTNLELKKLLTELPYAREIDGTLSPTATQLDLLGAALGLDDGMKQGRPVRAMFADIDDGSLDGFLRATRNDDGTIISPYIADTHGDGQSTCATFAGFGTPT